MEEKNNIISKEDDLDIFNDEDDSLLDLNWDMLDDDNEDSNSQFADWDSWAKYMNDYYKRMYYYGIFNKQIRRKISTYIKSFINKEDIFYTIHNKIIYFFKLGKRTNQYKENIVNLEIIEDIEKIKELAGLKLVNNVDQKHLEDNKSLSKIETNLMVAKNEKELSLFREILLDKRISSFAILALFRNQIIDGKRVELPDIVSNRKLLLDREYIKLFEPCILLENFVLRRYNPNLTFEDNYFIGTSEMLLDCNDLDFPISPIIYKFSVDSETYTNSEGITYPFYEPIREIHHYSKFGAVTLRMIHYYFAPYWQSQRKVPLKGFSKQDIKSIADKYFYFDIRNGFYKCGDTLIQCENPLDYIVVDKKALEIIFKRYRKSKNRDRIEDFAFVTKELNYLYDFCIDDEIEALILELLKTHEDFDSFFEDVCNRYKQM